MNVFLTGLQGNDPEIMQLITKIIANAINDGIKDFRGKNLSDEQLKELDPLIRSSIYNILSAFGYYDVDPLCREFVNQHLYSIPKHWEDVQLFPKIQKSIDSLRNKEISFNADFLNEQYKTGNIYYVNDLQCIQLRGSYEFIGIPYEDGKKLKLKITYHLGKEGYVYDYGKGGYVKK